VIHFKDSPWKRLSLRNLVFRSLFFGAFIGFSIASLGDYDVGVAEYQKKNFSRAFVEFEKASWENDARAQTALALMYKYGEGTKINLGQAYQWNLKAAQLGHSPAQYNVGIMLLDGVGVEKNKEKGRDFIALAAEQGFARAIEKIQFENEKMLKLEESSWSRRWDLRVPNHVRFSMPLHHPQSEKTFKIQLGAMSSRRKAEVLWNDLFRNNEALLSDLRVSFERVEQANKVIWRLRAGDFNTEENATEVCARLLKEDKNSSGCLVITDYPEESGHNLSSK